MAYCHEDDFNDLIMTDVDDPIGPRGNRDVNAAQENCMRTINVAPAATPATTAPEDSRDRAASDLSSDGNAVNHFEPVRQALEVAYRQTLQSVGQHYELLSAENRALRKRLVAHGEDPHDLLADLSCGKAREGLGLRHAADTGITGAGGNGLSEAARKGRGLDLAGMGPLPGCLAHRQHKLPGDRKDCALPNTVQNGLSECHSPKGRRISKAMECSGQSWRTPTQSDENVRYESHHLDQPDSPNTARLRIRRTMRAIQEDKNKRQSIGSLGLRSPPYAQGHGGPDEKHNQKVKVFADVDSMKEAVRAAIGKPEYDVCNLYKTDGVASWIARSQVFEQATLAVIAMNAVYIGVDLDYNKAKTVSDADPGWQACEHLFCLYFFTECIIRFCAFRETYYMVRDFWFVFDAGMACMMVFETWVLSIIFYVLKSSAADGTASERAGNASVLKLARLLRLTRMARMIRIIRAVPELMILVKGMMVAMRSVFFTLCLLVVCLYIFGIAFTQLAEGTGVGRTYFPTVPEAMNTLLLYGTLLEDCPDVINAIGDESFFLRALFLLFILLASLTVMNMLVGVLVEVVSVVSSVEKETMQVNHVRSRLLQTTMELDQNQDGMISSDEFGLLLQNPTAARALSDVGVDVIGLVDFHDYLFQDVESLSLQNFLEVVLSLRGTNTATVKDIVDLRKSILYQLHAVQDTLKHMCSAQAISLTPLSAAW